MGLSNVQERLMGLSADGVVKRVGADDGVVERAGAVDGVVG